MKKTYLKCWPALPQDNDPDFLIVAFVTVDFPTSGRMKCNAMCGYVDVNKVTYNVLGGFWIMEVTGLRYHVSYTEVELPYNNMTDTPVYVLTSHLTEVEDEK